MEILARTNEPGLGAVYAWVEDAGGEVTEEEGEGGMAEEDWAETGAEEGGAGGSGGAFDTFAEEEEEGAT